MSAAPRVVFLAVNASRAHASVAAEQLRLVTPPGVAWRTVEAAATEPVGGLVARVAEAPCDVLAATLYLFNRAAVLSVLRRCRALFPAVRIVVGGPECLGDNRALLADGALDAAVRGEGEAAWPAWLAAWDAPAAWRAVPGVCCGAGGAYHDGGPAPATADLDALPAPWVTAGVGWSPAFAAYETSRGCANGCGFCTSAGAPVRYRSLPRVRADVAAMRARGVGEVRLLDRTFNVPVARAALLVRLFRTEFADVRFHLEIDPARLGAAVVEELAAAPAGQFHVEAGVQTLGAGARGRLGRRATPEQTRAGLRRLCGLPGIAVHADLIAGLPGQTLADVAEDIAALAAARPAEIQLETLKLLPGTGFARKRGRLGLVAAPEPPYEVLRTATMDVSEMQRAVRWSRLLDWFYNPRGLRAATAEALCAPAAWLETLEEAVFGAGPRDAAPALEARFRLLARLLEGQPAGWRHALAYAWLRAGFSARDGLCPAAPWKQPIPEGAALLEGERRAAYTRVWRAELDVPHFFAYDGEARRGRFVRAVFRLGHPLAEG